MSTPITNIPQGILSLLGLRDMGAVPRFVEPNIGSSIDITPFLLNNREEARGVVNYNSVTSVTTVETTVPAGELWYVHRIGVSSAILAAGETIKIQPGYIWQNRFFPLGDNDAATAGGRASCGSWAGSWVPAGGALASRVNQITTAGTIAVNCDVNFTRLRI